MKICRHCGARIHRAQFAGAGERWGDGKYVVCNVNGERTLLRPHEPFLPEVAIAELTEIMRALS